jgi:hypothetical protein
MVNGETVEIHKATRGAESPNYRWTAGLSVHIYQE